MVLLSKQLAQLLILVPQLLILVAQLFLQTRYFIARGLALCCLWFVGCVGTGFRFLGIRFQLLLASYLKLLDNGAKRNADLRIATGVPFGLLGTEEKKNSKGTYA